MRDAFIGISGPSYGGLSGQRWLGLGMRKHRRFLGASADNPLNVATSLQCLFVI